MFISFAPGSYYYIISIYYFCLLIIRRLSLSGIFFPFKPQLNISPKINMDSLWNLNHKRLFSWRVFTNGLDLSVRWGYWSCILIEDINIWFCTTLFGIKNEELLFPLVSDFFMIFYTLISLTSVDSAIFL